MPLKKPRFNSAPLIYFLTAPLRKKAGDASVPKGHLHSRTNFF